MKPIYLSAAAAVCDLYLKQRAENAPQDALPKDLCEGHLRVTRSHNNGAAMNHLSRHPNLVLAGSGVITGAVAMHLISLTRKKGHALDKTALTLILGGAISNLADRAHRGYVVDYLQLPHSRFFRDVIFNLGDVFILFGAALFALCSLFGGSSE